MAIVAKTSATRELIPAKGYFGVLVGIYDIGTQTFKDKANHQVILQFEIRNKKEPIKSSEGRPVLLSEFCNLTFNRNYQTKEKPKLRVIVEALLGRELAEDEARSGVDITKLLDSACRVKVGTKSDDEGNPSRNVFESFAPLDDDDPKPTPESDSYIYELTIDDDIPEYVPDWVADRVRQSREWTEAHGDGGGKGKGNGKTAAAAKGKGGDDDVPF